MNPLSTDILDFLKDLSKNNNRDWFHTHKKRYEASTKKPFAAYLELLIEEIQGWYPELVTTPKESVFRIHRDTRFSKDKTPYKTNVSAILSERGRKHKEFPGYYIHLEPGRFMLGGGCYFMERPSLHKIRTQIQHQLERFQSLTQDTTFLEVYEEVQGDANKRIPPEFRDTFAVEPLIANKQFYFMAEFPAEEILGEEGIRKASERLKVAKPFLDFLTEVYRD